MSRLIDADALQRKICRAKCGCEYEDCGNEGDCAFDHFIFHAPTIEAEPVRHGEWVLGDVEPGYFTPGGNRPWICSECGQVVSWMLGKPNEKYCPNCGCKMDGESDE